MAPSVPPAVLGARLLERYRAPGLVALVLVLLLLGTLDSLHERRDADGLATTCRHFLEMSHDQRRTVMHEGGVLDAVLEGRITYFEDECLRNRDALDRPISDLW